MPFTRQDFKFAASLVKRLAEDKVRKMVVAEAYVDVFLNSNPRFRVSDFLRACNITEKQWQEERVSPMLTLYPQ